MSTTENITHVASDLQFIYKKQTAILFALFLLLYEVSAYIANDMIMPGMLEVVHTFSAPDTMVSTALSAYIMGGASLQLIVGPVSDRYGRRPVMIGGVLFFVVCTILISLAQSMSSFLIIRFFQGMGLCFISVIGYATLQELFKEKYAVRLIAIMNNVSILAPLAGPLLGTAVIVYLSWRFIFAIIAILSFIALLGIWFFMPETINARRIDGSLNSSIPLDFPTIKNNYLALLKNKTFMYGALAFGLSEVPMLAWIGVSPIIIMKAAHLSVIHYGLWQIPVFLCVILGTMLMRRLSYKSSLNTLIKQGSYILVASMVLMPILVYLLPSKYSYLGIILSLCIYSFGLGISTGPLNRKILFSTPIPKGTASALLSLIIMIFLAGGNQIAGLLYVNHSNVIYSLFCGLSGILYLLTYFLFANSQN